MIYIKADIPKELNDIAPINEMISIQKIKYRPAFFIIHHIG